MDFVAVHYKLISELDLLVSSMVLVIVTLWRCVRLHHVQNQLVMFVELMLFFVVLFHVLLFWNLSSISRTRWCVVLLRN